VDTFLANLDSHREHQENTGENTTQMENAVSNYLMVRSRNDRHGVHKCLSIRILTQLLHQTKRIRTWRVSSRQYSARKKYLWMTQKDAGRGAQNGRPARKAENHSVPDTKPEGIDPTLVDSVHDDHLYLRLRSMLRLQPLPIFGLCCYWRP
jgi:hypothetical protein